MLTVIYRYDDRGDDLEQLWFVGDEIPNVRARYVVGLWATGEEADHIEDMMDGGFNRVEPCYYGDLARSIYMNLGGDPLETEEDY